MSEPTKIEASETPALDDAVNESIRQYNKASRRARLSSIVLEKVDFHILPDALRISRAELRRELSVETDLFHFDSDDGDCIASIGWAIILSDKQKEVASCKADYLVFYHDLKGFSEDIIKLFIECAGKAATYAYFRALYAQLDWSASLGSPPLPVMSFIMNPKDLRSYVRNEAVSKGSAAPS